MVSWFWDATLPPVSLICLLLYHIYFFWRIRNRPLSTVVGRNHRSRRAWVRGIMRDEVKYGVLAVQTTRNSIMASTVLATTSIGLAAAVATFVATTASVTLHSTLENIVFLGSTSQTVLTVKFMALLICILCSFMCFIQAIRYTNHVNFVITQPIGPETPGLNPEYVSQLLARGSNFYTLGSRGYFFVFPILMWLFGPIFMLIASLLICAVLRFFDFVVEEKTDVQSKDTTGAGNA